MTLDVGALGPSVLAPAPRAASLQPGKHFVQLYDHDASLVDAVRKFVSVGLEVGDSVIVVATRAHRDAFEQALRSTGIDVKAERKAGRYISADDEETLAEFMVDGIPNRKRFDKVIGALITQAAAKGTGVRVFGEMVALLWAQGNVPAAIRLEELWNHLAETHRFKLFCAYPTAAFDDGSIPALREVCRQHSQVIPPSG